VWVMTARAGADSPRASLPLSSGRTGQRCGGLSQIVCSSPNSVSAILRVRPEAQCQKRTRLTNEVRPVRTGVALN